MWRVLRAAQRTSAGDSSGRRAYHGGETVSFGGLQLDMRGMSRVLAIDRERMTVRCEAGSTGTPLPSRSAGRGSITSQRR